jgi:two-component system, OmpR family, response regulator
VSGAQSDVMRRVHGDVAHGARGDRVNIKLVEQAETAPHGAAEDEDEVEQSGEFSRSASILLVDDDLELASEMMSDLTLRGYRVAHAATAMAALVQARQGGFDLLVIDRMLAGEEGLVVLQTLRSESMTKPVLVLSALGSPNDRIRGLRAGGDDYLVKPFVREELAARIEALLRRAPPSRDTTLQVGPLRLDLIERRAWRGEREIDLLPREFKLLEYLMYRPTQIVTRKMLLEDVWKYRFVPQTRVVDVHISKLRRKVDGMGEAPMIFSVRSAGFMLCAPS